MDQNQQTVTKLGQPQNQAKVLEQVIVQGDLSKLTPEQKVSHYLSVCNSLGLNHQTKPFEYIRLQGKETFYVTRSGTDQLRAINKVSLKITARENHGDVYVVTAQAQTPEGRTDESTGAVSTAGLKGEALANALMKAETKAKRRVTLSVCGLGFLDESETESVQQQVHTPSNTDWKKTKKPNPSQLERLYTKTDVYHWTNEQAKELIASFGVQSSKDLNIAQYEEICDVILPEGYQKWLEGQKKGSPISPVREVPAEFDFDGPYGDDQDL